MYKVLWFSASFYNRAELDKLSNKEKYEYYLTDCENACCWDSLKSFEEDLNDDCVNVENGFIYFIKID